MIPKMNSQQLNEIFEDAKNQLDKTYLAIDNIKNDIQKKTEIINYESAFIETRLEMLNAANESAASNAYKYTVHQAINSDFEKYGCTAHAKFVKIPNNVFNLSMAGLSAHYFREDVRVTVDEVFNSDYIDVLKHDSLDKKIFFDTYSKDEIIMEISLDKEQMLGSTRFNMIEIDPFLPGSFDISHLEIFEIDGEGELEEKGEIYELMRVGKNRFLLDKKVSFHTIKIKFKCNFQLKDFAMNSSVIPFGLKHIYFYDADLSSESFLVYRVASSDGRFFNHVLDKLTLTTPEGESNHSLKELNIEFFIDYNPATGELGTIVEPSTENVLKPIARNVSVLYAKVPLSKTQTVIAHKFFLETKIPLTV